MVNVIIRPAIVSDVEKIVPLWIKLMEFHQPIDKYFEISKDAPEIFKTFLTDCISQSDKIVIIAEVNHKVVGYMMGMIMTGPPVFIYGKHGEISDAFVDEPYRKQNIGEKIFIKMKEWFSTQGLQRVDINAAANNPVANNFWKKLGFKPYLNHMHYSI